MTVKQRLAAVGLLAALSLVTHFEGLRLNAYLDPVSIPTICNGHTKGISLGDVSTPEECEQITAADILSANDDLNRCIGVPLTEGQRGAFVDFIYNVGAAKFCASTMAKKLRSRDYAGACAELSRWVNANGKPLPGLVKRRAAERALCEGKST